MIYKVPKSQLTEPGCVHNKISSTKTRHHTRFSETSNHVQLSIDLRYQYLAVGFKTTFG